MDIFGIGLVSAASAGVEQTAIASNMKISRRRNT
jgi:hypothetical protein